MKNKYTLYEKRLDINHTDVYIIGVMRDQTNKNEEFEMEAKTEKDVTCNNCGEVVSRDNVSVNDSDWGFCEECGEWGWVDNPMRDE